MLRKRERRHLRLRPTSCPKSRPQRTQEENMTQNSQTPEQRAAAVAALSDALRPVVERQAARVTLAADGSPDPASVAQLAGELTPLGLEGGTFDVDAFIAKENARNASGRNPFTDPRPSGRGGV